MLQLQEQRRHINYIYRGDKIILGFQMALRMDEMEILVVILQLQFLQIIHIPYIEKIALVPQ